MRFSISLSSVALLTIYYASISEAARSPRPYWLLGYDCDDTYISGSRLQEVISQVKYAQAYQNNEPELQSALNDHYDGPPFTKSYRLWPVTPAEEYDEEGGTPYRAVITKDLRIFSVIIKKRDGVKECILRYKRSRHYNGDLKCSAQIFMNKDLLTAAKAACPLIKRTAKWEFPARYSGRWFREHNKQLYIYPIIPGRLYTPKTEAGPYRVVMNSQCKTVGALTYHSITQQFHPCRRHVKY